jgi:hypothetical protein
MCTPNFPDNVSFACVLDFIKNIKEMEKSVLELVEQGLWLSGSIVKSFQVKPVRVAMAMTEDTEVNITRLTTRLKSFFPENEVVALELPWDEILSLVLKLISELVGRI